MNLCEFVITGFDYANRTESQDSSDLQLQHPDDAYYMLIIGNILPRI